MAYKHCSLIDQTGYYKGFVQVTSQTGTYEDARIAHYKLQNGENLLDIKAPYGFVRAKWDGAQWVESASEAEVEAAQLERNKDIWGEL